MARDALAALENEVLDIIAREALQGPVPTPDVSEQRTQRELVMTTCGEGKTPNLDKIPVIPADDILVRSRRLAHQSSVRTQVPSVGTSRTREDVEPRKRSALLVENVKELAVPQDRRRSAGRKSRHHKQKPPNMAVDGVIRVAFGAQPLYETPGLGRRRGLLDHLECAGT